MASDETARKLVREFASDLVVRAGAGTGKTYTLVELFVNLCAGTTARDGAVPPGRILALTFSEKAAAELRERVRNRFHELGENPRSDEALEAAYACRPNIVPLGELEWRELAAAVGSAPIATFHSFAANLLRRFAPLAGIDASFDVLVQSESELLRRTAAEDAVLAALDDKQTQAATTILVKELGFALQGNARGLGGTVESLIELGNQLAEDARTVAALAETSESQADISACFEQGRDTLRGAFDELLQSHDIRGKHASDGVARRAALLSEITPLFATAVQSLTLGDDPSLHPVLFTVVNECKGSLGTPARNSAKRAFETSLNLLHSAHVGVRARSLLPTLLSLLAESERRYREAKQAMNVLDFQDLISGARDLLDNSPLARDEARARFDAILVDEFQDTNSLQESLLTLLQGEHTKRLVVGDPKQSIYEFRGADVAVFTRVSERVQNTGGQALFLHTSRRGKGPLVEFFNLLFERVLCGGEHTFEVKFTDGDALEPYRGGYGRCVELIDAEDEAAMVANTIRNLVDGGDKLVGDAKTARSVRYGDIAVLLRRFTHLDKYLQAMRTASVPHYVVNGRGFYESQEIRDLASLLALFEDPDDDLSLLAVLRSPMVAVSDTALLRLAQQASGRAKLSLPALLRNNFVPPPGIDDDERDRLLMFLRTYRRLRHHADRLGAAGLARAVIEQSDLLPILATTFHGEQKIANLERILEQAATQDRAELADRHHYVRRLRQEIERDRSLAAPAQILGESENVVRVMTIHQAKGLEFPVVFVPECGARERHASPSVVYDRQAGIGLRLRLASGQRVASPRAVEIDRLSRARSLAESRRLFYVACTRARDLLVLSSDPKNTSRSTPSWRTQVDEVLDENERASELVHMGHRTAAVAPATTSRKASMRKRKDEPPDLEDRALAARVNSAPRTGAHTITISVTALTDFASCPRRYHLRHEVGLEEFVTQRPTAGGPHPDRGTMERGTLAHRLLEKIDLQKWQEQGQAAVDEVLRTNEGSSKDVASVAEPVSRFLGSDFGQELCQTPAARIKRELGFALRVAGDRPPVLLLKGQIDLALVDDTQVSVVDYKLARRPSDEHSGRSDSYRFQLLSYALTARALFAKPIRVGLVYLLEDDSSPELAVVDQVALDTHQQNMQELAKDLSEARRTTKWSARPVARCRSLGCGYLTRCYPNTTATTMQPHLACEPAGCF